MEGWIESVFSLFIAPEKPLAKGSEELELKEPHATKPPCQTLPPITYDLRPRNAILGGHCQQFIERSAAPLHQQILLCMRVTALTNPMPVPAPS